jgi:hypothetical protein
MYVVCFSVDRSTSLSCMTTSSHFAGMRDKFDVGKMFESLVVFGILVKSVRFASVVPCALTLICSFGVRRVRVGVMLISEYRYFLSKCLPI